MKIMRLFIKYIVETIAKELATVHQVKKRKTVCEKENR